MYADELKLHNIHNVQYKGYTLYTVRKVTVQVVTGGMWGTSNQQLYMETGWETIKVPREKGKLLLNKVMNNEAPQYLADII